MLFSFDDFVLDVARRELRSRGKLVAVEPQVFDLLVFLIENRNRVVSRDDLIASVWGGRAVSDSTLDSRINAARRAVGDSGGKQSLIRTVPRKGVRFVGTLREKQDQPGVEPARPKIAQKQEVLFCRSEGNINIAYAVVGQGQVLIKTATWLTHLEYDWDSPVWSLFLQHLAQNNRLVRYDGRGNGLSDQEVGDISFAAFAKDFEAVIDAINPERFAILAMSQSASVAIDYAVRHPEKVSKLILYGGYATGRNRRGSDQETDKARTFLSMIHHGWGDEHSAFMRAFSSVYLPNGSPEQIKWFADLQRVTTTAENALRIRTACDEIDVSKLLPKLRVPTLILHSRHDNVVPLDQGRLLATSIQNARFVTLESHNHVVLPGEPAWPKLLAEIEEFLSE